MSSFMTAYLNGLREATLHSIFTKKYSCAVYFLRKNSWIFGSNCEEMVRTQIRCHLKAVHSVYTKWAATWQNQQNECAPREGSDQPGIHPVWSVFAVHMKKAWVLSYQLSAQRRLWSDWADAQADLSFRWAHCHFDDFVMSRLKLIQLNKERNITVCKILSSEEPFEPAHEIMVLTA